MGTVPQLEDALRALVHPPEADGASNPFDLAKLDGRGPLAGFVRIKPMVEAFKRQAEAMRRELEEFAEGEGAPMDDQADQGPEFPVDLLLEYIGDFAFQADSPDWGFSGEIVVMRPREE